MTNHVHGRPDNQDENLDDVLGRGLGDPDVWGFPGDTTHQSPPPYKEFDPNGKHPDWIVVDIKEPHWSEMEALKPKREEPENEWGDVF